MPSHTLTAIKSQTPGKCLQAVSMSTSSLPKRKFLNKRRDVRMRSGGVEAWHDRASSSFSRVNSMRRATIAVKGAASFFSKGKGRIVFMFTGQGTRYTDMARAYTRAAHLDGSTGTAGLSSRYGRVESRTRAPMNSAAILSPLVSTSVLPQLLAPREMPAKVAAEATSSMRRRSASVAQMCAYHLSMLQPDVWITTGRGPRDLWSISGACRYLAGCSGSAVFT